MKNRLLTFGFLTAQVLILAVCTSAQTIEMQARLKAPIDDIHLESASILKVFSLIAVNNKVPMGIELARGDELPEVKFDFEGTLEQGLDQLILLFPDYEWTVANGVVNFSPRKEQDNILNVIIEDYRTTAKQSYLLRLSILEAPEVVAKMKKMNVEPFTLAFGSLNARSVDENFSLSMRKSTVRQILNEIAKRTYSKYWVVERGGKGDEEIRVYL